MLRPSYAWLLATRHNGLVRFLQIDDPQRLVELRALPAFRLALPRQQRDAEHGLARVMIRTGKPLLQIRGADLLHYADVVRTSGRARREHLAWELLVALGGFDGEPVTLRGAWSARGNSQQHSIAKLVDRYGIPPSGVRDLLVDYLSEVRLGMDYSSLLGVAYRLVRLFWWEVLQINPSRTDLRLSAATATAWMERLGVTTDGRPRREIHSALFVIRALYRDIAEWGHQEPIRWGIWAAPCPVPRYQSRAASKVKRRPKADMQARTRVLTPLLPAFVAAAEQRRDWGRRLLELAAAAKAREEFVVDGVRFRRDISTVPHEYLRPSQIWAHVVSAEPWSRPVPLQNGRVDVTKIEEDGFWAWAVTEVLRHTGLFSGRPAVAVT